MSNDSPVTESPLSHAAATAELYDYALSGSRSRSRSRAERQAPATYLRYRFIKRTMDILLILLALPVLVPALGIVALMVWLTSPGPVFFYHRRLCHGGAFFSMWKFRTMCQNSAEVLEHHLAHHPLARSEWNKTHKLRNDPRITPVGRFLRRSSLDELPQIWNVLQGRMSLVGPRPIVAAEVQKYGDCFDCYTKVKPGVTGLWQVSGRSSLTYQQRVHLDCDYVKHWSLLGDCSILLRTLRSVVNSDGAY